jgi:hypothetical protein
LLVIAAAVVNRSLRVFTWWHFLFFILLLPLAQLVLSLTEAESANVLVFLMLLFLVALPCLWVVAGAPGWRGFALVQTAVLATALALGWVLILRDHPSTRDPDEVYTWQRSYYVAFLGMYVVAGVAMAWRVLRWGKRRLAGA